MLNLNAIDFDDILRYAYQILVESQLVRIMYQNVYTHLFVDEAQDLNISQYELIKQIAGNKMSIIMVGDPKQSIYGFNGASSKILTYNFFQDFTDGIQFKMLDNYRSAKKIVLAANKVENTFPMEVKYPIEGVFEICSFKNEIEEAAWIEENIEYLKTNGSKYIENEIQNEDIAILGRNRYVFKEIEKLLISKGIPYCAKFTNNKGDIFESNLFNEFILGLKNIDNPYDVFHKNILIDMLESKSDINTDIFLLKTIKKEKEREYKLLCDLWREMKSVQFHSINSKIEGYIKLLQNESEKSLIDNDCVVWKTIATNFCRTHQRSNQTLETFLSDLSMGVTSLPSDSGITLSTVHMSKGLQYDVVYIIGMNEGTFPDYRSMTAESLIEEKHSFFVAVTRAKRICYITYPLVKSFSWGNKEQLKSSFLDIFK